MARGVAPSVFSFDINPTQAISGRSSGSRIFSPPATNPGRIRAEPSKLLGNLFKAGTVCESISVFGRPSLVGGLQRPLFQFAARRLVTDDEGLVRSSMSHGGGKRLGLLVNG